MELTVGQLAEQIDAKLIGDGTAIVEAVGPIGLASQREVTFAGSEKFIKEISKSKAAAVIVAKEIESLDKPQLIVGNVDKALIATLKIFAPKLKPAAEGIDPSAKVGANVTIGKGVSIGPNVLIDDCVKIGDNTIIASGCTIGENTALGSNCRLDSNVAVYHNCQIGNHVIIQANSVIGATGFGYSFIDGAHQLIPHNGTVVIEDFVEIGACSCVDRAKFGQTLIGAGTKIDNLVQVAHNVQIGKCCLMAGQSGIGGSSKMGNGVVLAGHAGVVDNVTIGDGTIVCAKSLISNDIGAKETVFGMPATDFTKAMRIISLSRRLPEMVKKIKQLTSRIEELEASKNNKN